MLQYQQYQNQYYTSGSRNVTFGIVRIMFEPSGEVDIDYTTYSCLSRANPSWTYLYTIYSSPVRNIKEPSKMLSEKIR